MKPWLTAWIKKLSHADPRLWIPVVLLLATGTVMVYSASSPCGADRFKDSLWFLKRHLTYAGLGTGLLVFFFYVKVRELRKLALPALVASVVLLLATWVSPARVQANQAARWLSLCGLGFQPSEIVKPLMIVYVAAYLAKRGEGMRDFARGLLPLMLQVLVVLGLLVRQPDFGTAAVLAAVVGVMLFTADTRLPHLAGLAGVAAAAGALLIHMSPYRKERILAFSNPWADTQGRGFQIIQSFIAFHHGGWSGRGLGDGTQKLLYLPEAHTDFIFSVVAEELGLAGSLGVIALFGFLVVQGLRLSRRIRDPFASQVALGLSAWIGLQAFLNLAVVMGLVPTKGLTLPLMSYGGTSLVATLASFGILLSLSASVSMSAAWEGRRR